MTCVLLQAIPSPAAAASWVDIAKAGGPYLVALVSVWWAWQERSARLDAFNRLLALTEKQVTAMQELKSAVEVLTASLDRADR